MILTPLQKAKKDLKKLLANAIITDWFDRYLNKSRGLGNTTVLIAGCKAQGKVLIVHNADYAEQIAEAHKIKTTCVGDKNYATQPAGSVVDNHAILLLVRENQRIQALADHLLGIMEQKGID